MTTNIEIEVDDPAHAEAIAIALSDTTFRATAITIGVLAPMTQSARERILRYLADRIREDSKDARP